MNIVYNDDRMNVMRNFKNKEFNICICDPPYFKGPDKLGYFGGNYSKLNIKRNYRKSENWKLPDINYLNELKRISKNQIIWGINYYNFTHCSGRIVWDKCNGSSSFSDCEIASCSFHDSVRIFYFLWNGMMQGESIENGKKQQGNKMLNEKRIHPTQKPVALYDWMLQKYANPNDKIFDSHVGSGSIRISCHKMKLYFVGCEIDLFYHQDQDKRFNEYESKYNDKLYINEDENKLFKDLI